MHDWDPEIYEKSSSAQQRWADEILSRLYLRGDERILDIGCGDGRITAKIASMVPTGSVTGLDSSFEMIKFARDRYARSQYLNLDFTLGDASSLAYEDEFDLITSFACLHWVLDHRPVLAGIRQSLRPGGKTYMQFGGRGNAAEIIEAAGDVISKRPWSGYFQGFKFPYGFFGPEEYRAWADASGLRVKRIELIPKDMAQRGQAGLASWMASTWHPYTERVPEGQRESFVDRVVDSYIRSHPPDPDGQIHVSMMRLEVELEKD